MLDKAEVHHLHIDAEYQDIGFGVYDCEPAVIYPIKYDDTGDVVEYDLVKCVACFINTKGVHLFACYRNGTWDVTPCVVSKHSREGAYFLNVK